MYNLQRLYICKEKKLKKTKKTIRKSDSFF